MPVRQPGYPAGVALYGSEFVLSLVLIAISISLVVMAITRDAPAGILVSCIGLLAFSGGMSLFTGTGVIYQARPVPRSPIRESVVWRPPLVARAAIVVMLVAVSAITVASTTAPAQVAFPLIGASLLITAICARTLVARFEADHWGIRCTNPLTAVRIPWSDLESLEPRGKSVLTQRIVAITKGGRERMLWVFDPRIPASPEAARLLVAELETVWKFAAMPQRRF
jgi:hypothetical protein